MNQSNSSRRTGASPVVAAVTDSDPDSRSPQARAEAVSKVAAAHAEAVDRDGRYPAEAIAAARTNKLLGILVPASLGGEGATVSDCADVCYAIGRSCASSAMIYAMHQTKVACVLGHHGQSEWHRNVLRRIVSDQLLLASSTTEGQGGGNIRSSASAVGHGEGRIELTREATVISYGEEADGIVTTARRSAEAASSDQVLVVFLRQDYTLERTLGWDALGMRGTRSAGFKLHATGTEEQVLPEPYERIHAATMIPVAHILWSSTWTGIACGAVERAEAFTRKAARHSAGQLPPGAAHLTKVKASLGTLRALVASAARLFEETSADPSARASLAFQNSMNVLKVEASELAVSIVLGAFRACGLAGYRNDSEFSIGRHLRDVLSSPIMINNDRILANMATTALMSGVPARIRD